MHAAAKWAEGCGLSTRRLMPPDRKWIASVQLEGSALGAALLLFIVVVRRDGLGVARERRNKGDDEHRDHPDDHQHVRDGDQDEVPVQVRRWGIQGLLPRSISGSGGIRRRVESPQPSAHTARRVHLSTLGRSGGSGQWPMSLTGLPIMVGTSPPCG